jgi:penicillin-binding protein 1A
MGAVDINFLWLFGRSPGFASGLEPQVSQASELWSADGVMIGKYFNENRTPVEYGEVNPNFWKVLIDTEDERFYKHWGIDPIGLTAAAKDALLHHDARGASTITQQLAKNMFKMRTKYAGGPLSKIPGLGMVITKTKEWIVALKLEILYEKNEILTMYANTVDFGSNAFGIKTAAKTYFDTTPANLTIEQSAVLVGMLKATTYYNPISHPDNSLRRRNIVLSNMLSKGDLNRQEYDSLSKLPIKLEYSVESNYDGQAQYFREAVAKHLADWCEQNGYDLYNSGLKIYTTIDTRMQKYAEEAARKQMQQVQRNFNSHWAGRQPWVDEHGVVIPDFIEGIARRTSFYKHLKQRFPNEPDSVDAYMNRPHTVKLFDYDEGTIEREMSTMDSIRYMVSFMHCAFVAMEPQTGAVKAWVGDIDFDSWKYDKVEAMRQPGSTFKLFVYTEAMNQGLTPCDKRRDERISMQVWDAKKKKEVTWAPTNANGYFTGDSMLLRTAFAQSINSVAVRLGQEMGIKRIAETAHRMGITSPLDETPALALGSSDVNLLELTGAYCTIVDDGRQHDPCLVTRIVDKDDREVYVAPLSTEQSIPYKSAYLMQDLLKSGLTERGATSMSLWGYIGKYHDAEFGGKTGTSNNHSDAWFMGVSPKLVVGAWVGGEYRCIHFRTGALGQGSRTALPICGYFLESVLGDPAFKHYRARFEKPKDPDITSDMYICQTYYAPRSYDFEDDSLGLDDELILDDEGNPIPQEEPVYTEEPVATEQKEL